MTGKALRDFSVSVVNFPLERLTQPCRINCMEISNKERETIMAMSEEELSDLKADTERKLAKLLGQLKANMNEDQQKLIDRMVEAEKRKINRELDAQENPKSSLSPELRELCREASNSSLQERIPWRSILSQKATTQGQYKERILWAMCSSGFFDELPDKKKIRLADLLAEAWEIKRKDILDRMVDDTINKEEVANRLTKDGADALRTQRQKLVEDIRLGRLNEDKLIERLDDGMKQLASNRGSAKPQPPPMLLPAGPDIWTAVSGSACYRVPCQSKPRSNSTQRRYRDKEITHGFPVKNLREFFFFSNRIVSAGYDAPNRTLYLKFDANSMYQYFNVPEDIVRGLINASSHGTYASRRICYAFKYERLTFPA